MEYHTTTKYEKLKGLWAKHTYNNNKWTIANTYSTGAIPSNVIPKGSGSNRLELSTGMSEDFKAYNIYDLAGNMWEWTTETGTKASSDKSNDPPNCNENGCLTDSTPNAVIRGGGFNDNGSIGPVVYTHGGVTVGYSSIDVGFRVVLYLK